LYGGDGYTRLESTEPIRAYALIRVELALTGLVAALVLDFPGHRHLALALGVVMLPIALGILFLSRRAPALALNPAAGLIDLASLAVVLAIVPASYAAIHFSALVLVMAYALVRGERRGLVFAAIAVATLVTVSVLVDVPVGRHMVVFYEIVFAVAAVSGAVFAGRLAASEMVARLRARELTRRTMEAGYEARREVAQSLHDGPVQELVSADMKIEGAMNATARGDSERATELLYQAREVVERNISALRNELVGLGPVAFDELSFNEAVDRCLQTWSRRYEVRIETDFERVDMPNDVSGALFGIAQEAVANAGRHAHAESVSLTLRRRPEGVELLIRDNGEGFGDVSPLGPREPGHLGLASMRERAAIVGGELAIESGDDGTEVRVQVPGSSLA
jgi:signal transduction histidine kinase